MNFCDRLKNAREDRDITQQEMADLINMNQSNYSKIERGVQEPSLDQLIKISEVLKISIDELLGVDSDKYIMTRIEEFEKTIKNDCKKNFGK